MHRFYVPTSQLELELPVLTGSEARHLASTRRVKRGEQVVVFDGHGAEGVAVVEAIEKTRVKLRVVERRRVPPLPYRIALVQALLPHRVVDLIIQKATELGAVRIVPVLTQRSVVQIGSGGSQARMRRWQQIAVEAAKQCGTAWLPVIEAPQSLSEFLRAEPAFDLKLVGSLQRGACHVRQLFDSFASARGRDAGSAIVLIGPEGDLTPQELAAAQAAGFSPVTFGPLILRSETAAIYALSVLNHEFQRIYLSS